MWNKWKYYPLSTGIYNVSLDEYLGGAAVVGSQHNMDLKVAW